ncbi:MAG: cysteine--tRNA ligase [Candidatus Nealsonbacteria bacterium]|nr:cysteine--tRNA ligase [Candidatus Nealsonbacteria bacterium]
MLKLYSTLTRKKEIFKPAHGKKIKLFVCGPTVYDSAHIGHARTYLAFDMIAKYLKQRGFNIFYLQNITDIDDKIINRAKEKGISPLKLARNFEKKYSEDMKNLKVNAVTKYARATDYIKEIIGQVKKLLDKKYAYQIEDGIYYDISKFKNYGKLSGRTALQAEDAVSRIDEAVSKKNKGDFALWKISKPGEPKWPSPWGFGRPGWHIEDTAITEKFFGSQYDMHGGAVDLMFPHHEAEIAQMEAISSKRPMVKYWLHPGFLKVNGQKMSKSLGNFITIKDFTEKYSPRLLRFLILKNHYRSPIDYTEESVAQAERELEKIDEFVDRLKDFRNPLKFERISEIKKLETNFEKAMEDDFNTPKAIAVIFDLMRQKNTLDAKDTLKFLKQIDEFLNFIFWPKHQKKPPKALLDLVRQRQEYRKKSDWQKADEIRNEIIKLDWQVEDTKQGSKLKKIQR